LRAGAPRPDIGTQAAVSDAALAARALLTFLASPGADSAKRAHGMQPA
jgi:hypothetical protein